MGADHVPGGVLQEDERPVDLVGEEDELRRLLRLVHEEHPARVGEDADRVAVDRRPAGDQAGAVERLVLVEARAVDHPGEHLAGVEGHPQVGRRDAEELVGVVHRLVGGLGRARPELAPAQVGHDLPADPDAVALVGGEVVGDPRHPRVHLRAAERLVVGLLPGRHLHQRGPSEEDLRLPVDEHRVVAHPGHVGTARGGVAEDEGDRRDPHARQLGEVVEGTPRGDEEVGLGGQVGAAGLHQPDQRQPVAAGDLEGAELLAQGVRVHRTAAHGGVVGDDHALHAGHHPDPGDDRGADAELRSPGGERRELEEVRVAVEEELDPLVDEQPSAGAVALDVAGPAAGAGEGELLVVGREHGEQGRTVVAVGVAAGVHPGSEDRHEGNGRASGDVRVNSRWIFRP